MFRKIGMILFTSVIVIALGAPVQAAEQLGTIAVSIDSGLTDVTARRLVLFRVGEETEGGYRITEEFGGGLVFQEDALSPHLARMLSQSQGGSGSFRMVDADNTCRFTLVEPGLYLLMEEGENPMILPCMTAVPQNGSWEVRAYPVVRYFAQENPSTGQHPAPILGAIGMVLSGIGLAICAGVRRKE